MSYPSSAPAAGGAVRLAHSAVIAARGADAAVFLHGQLTNDFTGLGLGEARLAAYCSAKGRMLASFVGFKRSHDEIWLACRREVLPATLKRLGMFVLRSQVRLAEGAEDDAALVGLAGTPPPGGPAVVDLPVWGCRHADGVSLVRLPDAAGLPRWLWAGPSALAGPLLAASTPLSLDHWDWLEVRSGIAPVLSATVDAFVPQMLNYELVGGVNFQKGCYPGQEVVARSQYRGTLKRRAVLLHGETALQPGQEVYWSGDAAQPSGRVALAAPAPGGGWDAIVELKLLALGEGRLMLGAADGARLSPLPLPYALPREAATA